MAIESVALGGLKDEAELTPRARRIAAHLASKIEQAAVDNDPYQHFYVTDALPADVYAEIHSRLPAREHYLPLNIKRWRNAQGQSTRDRLCLSEGELELVPEADRAFWADVSDGVSALPVQRAAYARMLDDVAIRLGCGPDEVLSKPAWPSVLLVRDFEDYQLKPHPDGHPRVVTLMFYLAREGDPDDLGTSVYRRKSLMNQLVGDKFEEVKRFPFLPNSMAAFAVNDCATRRSWHGRELISGASVIRDSIIVAWLYEHRPEFAKKHTY
ncbi:MAG: hypothetical protein RLZ98_395 [Pseudomonadota bacterium]|jgi:hypothetical protein